MGRKEAYHDEIELEDFEYDEEEETYYYPCPCGDRFAITKQELGWGLEVATCPLCSLIVRSVHCFLTSSAFQVLPVLRIDFH